MFVRVGSVDVEKIYVGFVVLALQERIVFYWFGDGCVSFSVFVVLRYGLVVVFLEK